MAVIDPATTSRSLLRIADLEQRELMQLLDLAAAMKRKPGHWRKPLRTETLVCLFEKPSTRTRVSFAAAAQRLGMLPLLVRPDELQLGRGEPIADTARVLSSYAAAIVLRTFSQHRLEALASAATVPVINALSDEHHPCQALADLLTLRERFGDLAGLKLAYVGDANNVARSLMEAGALAGMQVVVASPPRHAPDPDDVAGVSAVAAYHGGPGVVVTDDPAEAVRGADAVYTDVWGSMGEDGERQERLAAMAPYQVDRALMLRAADDAVFMHCLPAHRGQEVTAAVVDGPASVVWEQAANRLPTEQALIYALTTGRWDGSR